MDTERDENQNLKNDIDTRENDTANNIEQNWYEDDLTEEDSKDKTDYTDDQNNSNTGYTEKLLEKELEQYQNDEIEDDPVVKNGIIIDGDNDDKNISSEEANDKTVNGNSI